MVVDNTSVLRVDTFYIVYCILWLLNNILFQVCLIPTSVLLLLLLIKSNQRSSYDTVTETPLTPPLHIYLCNCLCCHGDDSRTQFQWEARLWHSTLPGSICIRSELQSGAQTKSQSHTTNVCTPAHFNQRLAALYLQDLDKRWQDFYYSINILYYFSWWLYWQTIVFLIYKPIERTTSQTVSKTYIKGSLIWWWLMITEDAHSLCMSFSFNH